MLLVLILAGFAPADKAIVDGSAIAEQIGAGRELFVREWQVHDPRVMAGDGLGPMYNAASCVKCHRLGGTGGAGPNDDNVDLITLKVPRGVLSVGEDLRQRITAFHPALATGRLSATTVLHRFSPDPNYDAWRKRFFVDGQPIEFSLAQIVAISTSAYKYPVKATNPLQRLEGVVYQRSQRNTPALFGAGMIDRLPDEALDEIEQRQSKSGEVSGRVPRTTGGKVGRFGWRGQTESLHEFVLGACAVELGLEAPLHSQPIDPLRVAFDGSGRPVPPGPRGLDITETECKSLTRFVGQLPPPRQTTPADDLEAQAAARGQQQFTKIGCAECHVPQVAYITGIYSDLLLHDMGEALEDPVPANPRQGAVGGASYYGGGDSLLVKVLPEQRREWRTPPLWGLRDSGPYLHDGRAQTYSEAIAWHAGEAAKSAKNFRRLEKEEKEEVLAFLNCLAAPAIEPVPALENVVLIDEPAKPAAAAQ